VTIRGSVEDVTVVGDHSGFCRGCDSCWWPFGVL